jgi:hypothetical protein
MSSQISDPGPAELDVVERIKELTGYTDEEVREAFPTMVTYIQGQSDEARRLLLSLLD